MPPDVRRRLCLAVSTELFVLGSALGTRSAPQTTRKSNSNLISKKQEGQGPNQGLSPRLHDAQPARQSCRLTSGGPAEIKVAQGIRTATRDGERGKARTRGSAQRLHDAQTARHSRRLTSGGPAEIKVAQGNPNSRLYSFDLSGYRATASA